MPVELSLLLVWLELVKVQSERGTDSLSKHSIVESAPPFSLGDNNNSIVQLYCFDSLAIRLQSKDLKHLIPIPVRPGLQGKHKCEFIYKN